MTDKVSVYKLYNLDGSVQCNIGVGKWTNGTFEISDLRALPNTPTEVGQWVLDRLNANDGGA